MESAKESAYNYMPTMESAKESAKVYMPTKESVSEKASYAKETVRDNSIFVSNASSFISK